MAKEEKNIYVITTIRIIGNNSQIPQVRTVGWFSTQEEAFEVLDKNRGSLIEAGWYHYAVIEKFPEGLYPDTMHEGRRWFWKMEGDTTENEHWVRVECAPEVLKDDSVCTWCQIG